MGSERVPYKVRYSSLSFLIHISWSLNSDPARNRILLVVLNTLISVSESSVLSSSLSAQASVPRADGASRSVGCVGRTHRAVLP